jgi:hypothetical protein
VRYDWYGLGRGDVGRTRPGRHSNAAPMTEVWKRCRHPRRPETTCNVSAKQPRGQCKVCWCRAYTRRQRAIGVRERRPDRWRCGHPREGNTRLKGKPPVPRCLRCYRAGVAGFRTPTRRSWLAMWRRVKYLSVNGYENYGGRGEVCDRWRVFQNFLADMGERPRGTSLDRIAVDGNYEPGNCRWATAREQGLNQRRRAPR